MKQILIFLAVFVPFLPLFSLAYEIERLESVSLVDRALIPACLVLIYFARSLPPTAVERHARTLGLFVLIALVASLSVPFRMPTADARVAIVGVLRIAKFSAYALLGLAALRLFAAQEWRRVVVASWCSGVVVQAAALVYQARAYDANLTKTAAPLVRGNPVSVALAMLVASSLTLLMSNIRIERYRSLLLGVTAFGVLGMIFSQGRGGWVALVIASAYLVRRVRVRYLIGAALVALVAFFAAANSRSVATNMRKMIVEEQGYTATGEDDATELDDGARIQTWVHEASKLSAYPLLGWGIFHRGGASPLWSTGSHNFFLQMFLETGLLGGTTFLWFIWVLWRDTRTLPYQFRLGSQAVLLAMLAGGMGGEYFYGDLPLYAFFIGLWMLAIRAELPPSDASPETRPPAAPQIQPRRSPMVKRERRAMPSAASASLPPSPRSTMQSAPMT